MSMHLLGRGDTLLDTEVEHVKKWVKDILHIKLDNLDHSLGVTNWKTSEAMMPITYFLESFL